MSLEKKEKKVEKKEEKKDEKDDQNEIEFQKLVSYIKKAPNNEGDLDPLIKIGLVIQSIQEFYKNDEDLGNTYESKEKEKKSLIFSALCKKEAKDGKVIKITTNSDRDSAAVEIKLIIERCKKNANSKKEKENKNSEQESTSSVMNSVKKMKQSKNNPNLTGNFEKNVKLLKGVFNYLHPFIMYSESIKETIENETNGISEPYTLIQMLYFIMRTTRNVSCHLRCFFDPTLTHLIHSNITNLYDILGVDLKKKKLQKKLKTDYNSYYYFDEREFVDFANGIKKPKEVSRDTINREIKSLIMRGHSEGEVKDSDSKSIILFGKLLHHLVGTKDAKNWINITTYFDGYKIEPLNDGVNGASSADPNNLNITLKRKQIRENPKYFFFEATKLIGHWAQMPLRDKDEGGSNIGEIHSTLATLSEKKEQLNNIINLFKSPNQSGSADKIGNGDIDVFFEQLIDCKKMAYISSADATILSNNSELTQAALEQLNERLTADSIRLVICPLEFQNQWFLFVADLANNQCSLLDHLGNDSVSAPHVKTLCKTFLNNLKKLKSLKDIPKGEGKKQPQNIDEDCGSFICSLAFNLVFCLLNLYSKDVPRIIMAIKIMKNEPGND